MQSLVLCVWFNGGWVVHASLSFIVSYQDRILSSYREISDKYKLVTCKRDLLILTMQHNISC